MGIVVLCDFDGTVMEIDTSEVVLEKFAVGDWKTYDEQLEKREINIEECMEKQFAMVRAAEDEILRQLEPVAVFRPNFNNLVNYCSARRIPFILASAGLDFVINHFLRVKGLQELVSVRSPKAECTTRGMKLTFPSLFEEGSLGLKDDLVMYYKRRGRRVVYIGDGSPDYPAAIKADHLFVIENSRLEDLCRRERIPHKAIRDFREVLEALVRIETANSA